MNQQQRDPETEEREEVEIGYEGPDDEVLGLDPSEEPQEEFAETQETEEPEQRRPRGNREPMPEYDAGAMQSHLYQFAEEAAAQAAWAKRQAKEAELAQLPRRLPTEEELLRMSETQRAGLTAAIARRERVLGEINAIDYEFQQTRSSNQMLATSIVNAQKSVTAQFPNHWPKIMDVVRNLVDSSQPGQVTPQMLANPNFYSEIYKRIRGEEVVVKETRKQFRQSAARAQLAGRGQGVPVNQGHRNRINSQFSASELAQELAKLGFDEKAVARSVKRNFPGVS